MISYRINRPGKPFMGEPALSLCHAGRHHRPRLMEANRSNLAPLPA
jgi:hypothetical protein